jgi:hypothetical protein
MGAYHDGLELSRVNMSGGHEGLGKVDLRMGVDADIFRFQ